MNFGNHKIVKKGSVLLAFMLLLNVFVVSGYDNETQRYENGTIVNLSSYCSDISRNPCGAGTNCNLTLYFPNGTLLINDSTMNALGSGVYNQTLGNLTLEGDYPGSIFCSDGTYNGTSPVLVGIVDDLNPPNIVWTVAVMAAMLGALWLFYRLSNSLSDEHTALKFLLTFLSFWTIVLCVGMALNMARGENAASTVITNLTSGYKLVLYSSVFVVFYLIIYFVKQTFEGIPYR